jgi:hypothetical protein
MVINAGALSRMIRLLQHTRLNIVKEAAWTVSNITAGNSEQIQKVLVAGIVPVLLHVLQTVISKKISLECVNLNIFREILNRRKKLRGPLLTSQAEEPLHSWQNSLRWER